MRQLQCESTIFENQQHSHYHSDEQFMRRGKKVVRLMVDSQMEHCNFAQTSHLNKNVAMSSSANLGNFVVGLDVLIDAWFTV